jgi:hypothetical protein
MLLITCGEYAGCGGVAVSLAKMLWMVDLEKGESCAWWFGPGNRRVGLLTMAGLFGEYVVRMCAGTSSFDIQGRLSQGVTLSTLTT